MNTRLIWNFEINDEAPLSLPPLDVEEADNARWESRFFWPEHEIIVLNGLDERFLDISRYEAKRRHDVYCLLDDQDYNLKIRRNQLLYKPVISKTEHAVAYGKKIDFEEEHNGRYLSVEKEALIYRFETSPITKLELARLKMADTIWFSVNIESRAKHWVDSIREQMFGEKKTSDYVTFLKSPAFL